MSLLDLTPKRRLAKKQNRKLLEARKSGILVSEPPVLDNNKKRYFIFVNALLNFLVVVGTVGVFVEAFDIKCNMYGIVPVAGMLSVYMAMMYYNRVMKIIGYVICVGYFFYMVMNNGLLIRGGFAYICNAMMEFLQDELDLPIERSYDVYGYSETFAITISLAFIIFCVMLMFNMAISESKGFVLIFIVTFPVIQLALYFDKTINVIYFIMYMTGLICLAFFRNSSHFHMEYKKRKGYKERKHKNIITYNYTNDGKHSVVYVLSIGLILLAIAMGVSAISPQKDYIPDETRSEWKYGTRDFARQFALVGFWGMVNPNAKNAGGVGKNKMGDNKYVSLDYTTDLVVTMPITDRDVPLYLKAFYGTYYKDAYWSTSSEREESKQLKDYGLDAKDVYSLPFSLLRWYYATELSSYDKMIQVVNVAANPNYYYTPYWTKELYEDSDYTTYDDETRNGLKLNWQTKSRAKTINKINSIDSLKSTAQKMKETFRDTVAFEKEDAYYKYVQDTYMEVPEENVASIQRFCDTYGIDKNSKDIVEKVTSAFKEDYEYTLMPGRTPANKEFVNYFLDKQKKGYCIYFATSSTLIFRYLGIPARYTGGYVLFTEDYMDGKIVDEDLSEWTFDTKDYSQDDYYGVGEFELSDANAHAWVEIYIDGFGWVPVDTTPPVEEEEETKQEQSGNNNIVNYLANNVFTPENIKAVRDTTSNIFLFVMFAGVATVIGFILFSFYARRRHRYHKSSVKVYQNLCRGMKALKIPKEQEESYEAYGRKLSALGILDEDSVRELNRIVEKEKYSGTSISREELAYVQDTSLRALKEIYGRISILKRFIYQYLKWI